MHVDIEAFQGSPVGQVTPIRARERGDLEVDHYAFVPAPLPHEVILSPATYKVITEASLAIGRLDQAPARLPAHHYLIRLAVRLEARSTSALEGTFTRLPEVLESDYLDDSALSDSQRAVKNYISAAEWAYAQLESEPLSFGLLSRAQAILLRAEVRHAAQLGQLRTEQAFVGSPNRSVLDARYVPPPPGPMLESGTADWDRWLREDDDIPLVARVALAHYQFEALHPFTDGNGRLGRLASVLQLVEAGALSYPIIALSPWLEENKERYQHLLLNVSRSGDFDPWVRFFSEAVRDQAVDALRRIERLVAIGQEIVARLKKSGVRGLALNIAESLVGYPVITVRAAAHVQQVTYQGANRAVGRLVDEGVLQEATGRRSDRLFVCPELYQAVTE